MALLSLFGLGWRAPDELKPGESYRRWQGGSVAETATVSSIRLDLVGIPHVVFWLAFECSDANAHAEGWRTLALDSFRETYRERIHYEANDTLAAQETAAGLA